MVRSDKDLDPEIAQSKDWDSDVLTGKTGGQVDRYKLPDGIKARLSFSGSERNSVFIQKQDNIFSNVSGLSGLDSKSDGRTVAIIDLDHDGHQDIIMTNANRPTLSIHRNQIGHLDGQKYFLVVRVVGGNQTRKPSPYANRDGIGAIIQVRASDLNLMREVRCGEGLATQNSSCYLFGLGDSKSIDEVSVKWPSGQKTTISNVDPGSILTVFENVADTSAESGIEIEKYLGLESQVAETTDQELSFPVKLPGTSDGFKLVLAMATWCESCKSHLPDLHQIQQVFGNQVERLAIAVDEKDTAEMLDSYMASNKPAYTLLPQDRNRSIQFTRFVVNRIGGSALPYSVLVSPEGNAVLIKSGLPSISEIKRAIQQAAE